MTIRADVLLLAVGTIEVTYVVRLHVGDTWGPRGHVAADFSSSSARATKGKND